VPSGTHYQYGIAGKMPENPLANLSFQPLFAFARNYFAYRQFGVK
jgi:hypothetical protein